MALGPTGGSPETPASSSPVTGTQQVCEGEASASVGRCLAGRHEHWPEPPLLSPQESPGSLSYSNSIRSRIRGHPGRVIVRHKVHQLKFTCRVGGLSAVEIIPGADVSRESIGYDVSISFLESPMSLGPHDASQRKAVFLQATLQSPDPSLRLFVDTCVASPDPHDFTTVKYDLIRQG